MTKIRLLILFALLATPLYTVHAKITVAPLPPKKDISAALQKTLEAKGSNLSADDLAQIEAAAKRVKQQSAQMEQQANQVKDELEAVNRKMREAAKKIQAGEDELARQQKEIDALQKHLNESEQKFNAEHGMLVETLAALQTLALRPSEAVLIQPLSPVEVMRSSILLRGSVHVLKDRAESIRQSIEDINSQKTEINKRLKDIERENTSLAQQQDEMERLSKQKSAMYHKLSAQSIEAKQKAQQLAGQANDLRDLLDKLEKQKALERQRRQLAEKERLAKQQATEELRQANNHTAARAAYEQQESLSSLPKGSVIFSKAKGRLLRPARGPIITAFHQEMSKGVSSNGIDIKTASKAQIIAPYDGTVIFAGPFKNFANLVIIDHGEGYTSLLSGLNETYTEVGQMILAGEPVGVMPKGDNTKLHMEIRKNNHPVNPTEWMTAN